MQHFSSFICFCFNSKNNQLKWSYIDSSSKLCDVIHSSNTNNPIQNSFNEFSTFINDKFSNGDYSKVIIISVIKQMEEIICNIKNPPDYCIKFADIFNEYKDWLKVNNKIIIKEPQTLEELNDILDINIIEDNPNDIDYLLNIVLKLLDLGHIFKGNDYISLNGNDNIKKHQKILQTIEFIPPNTNIKKPQNNNKNIEKDNNIKREKEERKQIDHFSFKGMFVIRLRGLPWDIKENDIINFFSGLTIPKGGIYFCTNNRNRRTGEGYVLFQSKNDYEKAVKKHKEYIGKRYIEIFASSMNEWYQLVNCNNEKYKNPSSSSSVSVSLSKNKKYSKITSPNIIGSKYYSRDSNYFVVRMIGLSYSVTVKDILLFFHNLEINENDIFIINDNSGGITKEAYIKFYTSINVKKALNFNNSRMGQRYIELFESTENELVSILRKLNYKQTTTTSSSPLISKKQRKYFERETYPYNYPNERRTNINSNYNLPYDNYNEYNQTRNDINTKYYRNYYILHVRGLPYSISIREIEYYFSDSIIQRHGIYIFDNREQKLSEAFVKFNSEKDLYIALQKHNGRIGDYIIDLNPISESEFNQYYNRINDIPLSSSTPSNYTFNENISHSLDYHPQLYNSYSPDINTNRIHVNYHNSVSPFRNSQEYIQSDLYLYPQNEMLNYDPIIHPPIESPQEYNINILDEASIVIRGLTAQVTVADIQQYFAGYEIIPNAIEVTSNIEKTIFEAKIQFSTIKGANKALKEKASGYIGTCYINLSKR